MVEQWRGSIVPKEGERVIKKKYGYARKKKWKRKVDWSVLTYWKKEKKAKDIVLKRNEDM